MDGNEFIIWGVAPNTNEETLLVSENAGISSIEKAKEVLSSLEANHGCTSCRIQVFNLRDNFDWGSNLFSK